MTMTPDAAEEIGLKCLAWLVGEEDLLPVFLGATGASEADLRTSASDPVFLGSVLDFLLMDDAWILQMSTATGLAPDLPYQARQALPGGDNMHWT